jgi:hypothetical protein
VALGIALAVGGAGSAEPPATGTAALVPGDALAYVHLSTDPARPAVAGAVALEHRLPAASALLGSLSARLGAILGRPGAGTRFSFADDVRPWLGKEAAFALLETQSSTADSLILLDIRNRPRAQAFLNSSGATQVGTYRGIPELGYRSGTVLAFVRHYLAIGQPASVEATIDAADGSLQSLKSNPTYVRAASSEPADRVLDAYVSADAVSRVLATRSGLLGAVGSLLERPDLAGATFSLSPTPGGARVTIHSALQVAGSDSPAPAAPFTPTLPGVLPTGSSLLLDVRGLGAAAPRILTASALAGVAPRVAPLLDHLGGALSSEGVSLRPVASLFSGETAVALVPGQRGAGTGPGLVIVSRTPDQDQARTLLGNLEAPLAQLFPPPSSGPGQAAEWNSVPVAGVTAEQLAIAPGVELNYAVFRGLVVVSTSLSAIGEIARRSSSLAGEPAYQAALPGGPGRVTSLVFLDFSQLLNLGEQIGLTSGASVSALRPDLEQIRAVGLSSTRGEADTTAELFLQINEH